MYKKPFYYINHFDDNQMSLVVIIIPAVGMLISLVLVAIAYFQM